LTPPLWLVILGLELPAIVAMLDCLQRPADHFEGGAEDRKDWIRWLVVAIVLVPVLLGYGILLGYYYVVIRRNTPGSPR
jgi:nitrate reductase NapE component